MTDLELLREYGRNNAQDAFATLVARHLNLVYSAARRQVRSPELAEEVTQAVFIELSRQALRLPEGTHLASWLYVVARRRAIDAIRREARRAERENAAAEFAVMNAPPPRWSEVEPWLDQALHSLRPLDRHALLLRFFENKSLREIGDALGIGEDSAQKRLHRALDRLRAGLARRGITTTAAALAGGLATQGVQAAPAGLGATISAAVATSGGPLTAGALSGLRISLASWVRRHGLPLAVTAAAVTVLTGLEWFERSQRQAVVLLESRRDALVTLQAERDRARAQTSPRDTRTAETAAPSAIERRIRELLARVAQLREALDRVPGARTPEIALLQERDWLLAAQQSWSASTEDGVHHGLGYLQLYAKSRFAPLLSAALRQYLSATGGQAPASAAALAPYFSAPIDPAILARFAVKSTRDATGSTPRIQLREVAPDFDDVGDRILEARGDSWAFIPVGNLPGEIARAIPPTYQSAAQQAALAYGRAHDGASPARLEDLLPYFADPAVGEKVLAARDDPGGHPGLAPEELEVVHSVERALTAYKSEHHGAEPPTFAALAPYFRTPEEAKRFQEMAQRHGKVLP